MADVFGTKTTEQRGLIIRKILSDPFKYGADDGTVKLDFSRARGWKDLSISDRTTIGTAIKVNGTNQVFPTVANAEKLKVDLKERLPNIFDFLGNVKSGISNDFLGNLTKAVDLNIGYENPEFAISKLQLGTEGDSMREVGLRKGEAERDIKKKAITNPDVYVNEVNQDLDDIDKKAFAVYQQSFNKYAYEYLYPSDEARKLATQDMETYRNMLMRQHDAIYQTKEYKSASKRIISNPK
jgi:hypothetical protein